MTREMGAEEGGDTDGIGGGEKRERADTGIEVTEERGEGEGGDIIRGKVSGDGEGKVTLRLKTRKSC